MSEEEILGAIQTNAAGTYLRGHGGIGRAVDVGQEFDRDAVQGNRLLIAVFNQALAQVEILALKFAVGGFDFGPGVDVDVSFSAIECDQVARMDLAENAA